MQKPPNWMQEFDSKNKAEREAKAAETAAKIAQLKQQAADRKQAAAKAQADAAQARQEAQVDAASERFDAMYKAGALSSWLGNGGSKDEFAAMWPGMRQEIMTEKVLAESQQRRQRSLESARQRF